LTFPTENRTRNPAFREYWHVRAAGLLDCQNYFNKNVTVTWVEKYFLKQFLNFAEKKNFASLILFSS